MSRPRRPNLKPFLSQIMLMQQATLTEIFYSDILISPNKIFFLNISGKSIV